jgi:catechol 2,3-dioxygenase-like lactoylglutathione lyase family enzyme
MIRIGSIVLRVDDLQRQTEFWEAALGYDFVLLGPLDGAQKVCSVYGAERSQPVATGGTVVQVAKRPFEPQQDPA